MHGVRRGFGWAVVVIATMTGWMAACGDDAPTGPAAQGSTGAGSTGNGSTDSGGAEPNVLPTVEIAAVPSDACGADGTLVLRATRVGCVSPPPAPCTLPTPPRSYEGDPLSCPADESSAPMRVQLEQPGRYFVELVHIAADQTETAQCFAQDGVAELLVDDDTFAANPTISATSLGSGACG